MINKIVIATNNLHKLKEINSIFLSSNIEVLSLKNLNIQTEIIEDGKTLEENSFKKATEIFKLTQLPTIADDTGLEVFALNGKPGVYSSRFAGTNATYIANCDKLLNEMKNIPFEKRDAQFRCVISFVANYIRIQFDGILKGKITTNFKGENGFGYDSIFFLPSLNKTLAEISFQEKNRISHRKIGFEKAKNFLLSYFSM